MINKLYLSKLLLSSLLVCSSLYAGNTKCEDCHDPVTKNAAALHYTVSKPNSPETKYWDDFVRSKEDIVPYVHKLSSRDSQAAMWFLMTGGKHGFSTRQATTQEQNLLENAIKQIAISYTNGANNGRGLQEWSQVSTANHAGHLHLQMIYKQIDELKSEVSALQAEVKLLKAAQENTDKKYDNIFNLLQDEKKERTESIEKLTKTIQAQTTSLPTLFDKITETAKESEKKWIGILAELKADREKDSNSRQKDKDNANERLKAKKDKNKELKKQLQAYKDQENNNKLTVKEEELKKTAEREKAAIQREEAGREREIKANNKIDSLQKALLHLGRAHTKQPNITVEQILDSMNG